MRHRPFFCVTLPLLVACSTTDGNGAGDGGNGGQDSQGGSTSLTIRTGETAADGCTPVELNTSLWSPISAAYNPNVAANDPFFQLHDVEDGFFFNVELYTMFGAGWTGQTGTFATDCDANGICVHFLPFDTQDRQYVATSSGEIEITALSETGGQIGPVDVTMRNLTMNPSFNAPDSPGCYHIDEVRLTSGL